MSALVVRVAEWEKSDGALLALTRREGRRSCFHAASPERPASAFVANYGGQVGGIQSAYARLASARQEATEGHARRRVGRDL